MTRILIIEDELAIAEAVKLGLSRAGYESDIVAYGAEGQARAVSARPAYDLVILDVGLPDISGFEVCRRLREEFSVQQLPVLFLTAHNEEIDRVLGLEMGGGDYMTKPFSLRELVTRVRLLMQRHGPSTAGASPTERTQAIKMASAHASDAQVLHSALGFTWHPEQAWAAFEGQRLDLTLTEFRMLTLMLAQPRRVFSRQQLLGALRGDSHPSGERTIDTHIKTLRAKLRATAEQADQIRTRRGLGYSCGDDT